MPYVAPVCQGLLAVVLLVSTVGKLRSGQALRTFAASLAAMRLSRPAWAGTVAALVAGAEGAAALLLVIPSARNAGFAVAAVLLAVLTVGVAVVLARGTMRPCRCFGASATPLGRRHLVRNVLLCVAAVVPLAVPAGGAQPAGTAIALFAGGAVGLLVTVLDDLVALFTPAPSH